MSSGQKFTTSYSASEINEACDGVIKTPLVFIFLIHLMLDIILCVKNNAAPHIIYDEGSYSRQ